jgi:predicted P-loop ATPase
VRFALKDLSVGVKYNLMSGRMEINGMPDKYSLENAPNTLPTMLIDFLKCQGINCSRVAMGDYLNMISDEGRYHPVADMLNKTEWDGGDRIEIMCAIIGIEPHSFHYTLFLKWLTQCVALALNDDVNPVGGDGVLVWQGSQGIGKTLLFRKLAIYPSWFCEGATIDLDNKDTIMRATGAWITELGELDYTFKREQAALKAFLTATADQYRPPYGQSIITRPRRTSFAATVNPMDFLRDDTGSRRFWVVPLTNVDVPALLALSNEWLEQMWAQVRCVYDADKNGFRLTIDERNSLEARNRVYDKKLPLEVEVMDAFDFGLPIEQWQELSASDVKRRLVGYNGSAEQVGRVLKKLMLSDSGITSRVLRGRAVYKVPIAGLFTFKTAGAERAGKLLTDY